MQKPKYGLGDRLCWSGSTNKNVLIVIELPEKLNGHMYRLYDLKRDQAVYHSLREVEDGYVRCDDKSE